MPHARKSLPNRANSQITVVIAAWALAEQLGGSGLARSVRDGQPKVKGLDDWSEGAADMQDHMARMLGMASDCAGTDTLSKFLL